MPVVEEDSIMKHIIELSSETYEGRLAGTKGYNEAVMYVENVLESYGIKVSEQLFELECNEVENCKFNVYLPGTKDKRTFILGNDFCCAGMKGRGCLPAWANATPRCATRRVPPRDTAPSVCWPST